MSESPCAISRRKVGLKASSVRRVVFGAGLQAAAVPVPAAGDLRGQQRIGHLGLEAEFVARVGGHGAAIGARDAVEDRIGTARRAPFGVGVVDREGRVVAADDLAVRAQAFHESILDEAARLRHHVERQAGQLRHPSEERLGRGALRRRAGHGRQIVGHGEFFRVRQRRRVEGVLALEFGRRQRRQLQGRAQRELVVAEGQPAFQHGRQHDDAGGHDALVALQRAGHLGGAEAAIAFAEQIFRRGRAIVLGDVERDRLRERIGVGADAPEMFGVVRLDRAAPAGADRIDQN